MATISQEDVANVGSGLIAPKFRHRFRLLFQKADGSAAPDFDFLATQVIAFDLSSELLDPLTVGAEALVDEYPHRTGKAVIWVEDDIVCGVMKTVRKWQAGPYDLKLILAVLNGDEDVLEAYTFTNVRLDALQHSLWSYSDTADSLTLRAKSPEGQPLAELSGTLYAATSRSTSMKLLQVSFKGFHHSIATEPVKVTDLFK